MISSLSGRASRDFPTLSFKTPGRFLNSTTCSSVDRRFGFRGRGGPMKTRQEDGLTARQKQEYEQNGFFIVPNLVPAPLLQELADRLDQAALGKLNSAIGVQVEPALLKSGEATDHPLHRVRKVWYLANNDPFFRDFVSQDRIVEMMRQLLGPNLRYFGDEAQLKPPFQGSAHAWHQDAPYFHPEPFDFASLWIAVDRATEENGC